MSTPRARWLNAAGTWSPAHSASFDQAARQNLISFAGAIGKLERTSFRSPRRLVDRLLEEHARRQASH